MRKFFLLIISILFLNSFYFGQTLDISKIDATKIKLERLQKELWEIDFDQHNEIEQLRQQKIVKGEFEITKQFEEREKNSKKKFGK